VGTRAPSPKESGLSVKLAAHLHLVPKSRMVELYNHSPIRLHGVVLNQLNTGTNLFFLPFTFGLFILSLERCDSFLKWTTIVPTQNLALSVHNSKEIGLPIKLLICIRESLVQIPVREPAPLSEFSFILR
jgi:hypothetical protein